MKVKVLKAFKDKYTGQMYKVNEVISVTKKRYTEIVKIAPLVEEVKEESAE